MTPEAGESGPPQSTEDRWQDAWRRLFPVTFDYDYANGRVQLTGAEKLGYEKTHSDLGFDDALERVHPDDHPVLDLLASQAPGARADSEIRIRDAQGQWRWMHLRTVRQPDRDAPSSHLMGVLEESQVPLLQDELAAERERHAQTAEELREFSYVTSHDLQEPLRTITAMIELLNDGHRDRLDAEGCEYLDFIHAAAGSLQLLINDLLVFSRVNTQPDTRATVDLNSVAAEAIRYLKAAISEAGAQVQVDPLPEVSGDPRRLLLLFQNLIGNAVKFRSRDRIPQVHVAAREEPGACVLTVSDNGIGIDPQQHERIFRLFHRLHPASQYSGSGLGLAICERIVTRHGGRIWVESNPGEGARFQLSLPR